MAFGGTLVVAGTAKGVVTATGAGTELGRISQLLNETVELETPLTRRLGRLARAITLGIVTVAALIFLVGLLRDSPLLDSAMAAITLAVASIPEGLPAVITIASAIGVRRMARRKAIIRHLPAVETLGSTTVICTDKTGTLTRNEMTVEALWTPVGSIAVTGTGYAPEGELRENADPTPDTPRPRRPNCCAPPCCAATRRWNRRTVAGRSSATRRKGRWSSPRARPNSTKTRCARRTSAWTRFRSTPSGSSW
jgi:magnesium-transporting ATPase (P-type)